MASSSHLRSFPGLERGLRKYLKFTILTLVAVAVLWWFGRDLDWVGVRAALERSDWRFIAAAVALVCVIYLVRAFRWRTFLAPLARDVSLRELFAATTVGFGAIFLVGRAGEVLRPAFLSLRERRVDAGASFVTIGVERIYDMSAIVVLFAANLLVFRAPGGGDAAPPAAGPPAPRPPRSWPGTPRPARAGRDPPAPRTCG